MSMVSFNIVVAMDLNRGIGKNGRLPWHLPADLKHFKEVTTKTDDARKKNVVMMGRKTWESLPEKFRPLPERVNVVLTRHENFELPENVLKGDDLKKIFGQLDNTKGAIFIIGGGEIFNEVIQYPGCQKIYATHVQKNFDCDTFFPEFKKDFKEITRSPILKESSLEFFFVEYVRKGQL